jgi:DNA-binding transcriptional MocR family regulator
MRLERRNALVKIIQKHALKVIEDSVFRFTSDENLPTFYELLPTQCYHIMGISKMINPGFRMAYLLLPKTASTEVIAHHLHNLIFMPSPITAEMAACLQASHRLDGLLALRRKILANRNQIYNKVIESASGNMQNESCAMFRFLPCMNPPSDLEPAFLNAGIQVYSANRFRINEGVGANGVRIALCNARSDEALHALLLRVKGIVQKL